MSNIKLTEEAETFTSRLDILSVTPRMYTALINLHATTPRAVVCAVGPAGIGKSAIPKQVAATREVPIAILDMPTMGPEDWHIPSTDPDNPGYYKRRSPGLFRTIIEFTAKIKAENGGVIPPGKNPILLVEEINRTVDKHVTRQLFTLLEDRRIGDLVIDEGIQIIVTMNPPGGGMSVNSFEKDPALLRRLVMVGVSCSYVDFLKHAKERKYHKKVIEHLEAQPTLLYDTDAVAASKKFACPAAWETVSQTAYALDRANLPLLCQEARAAFSGIIGLTATERFLEFVEDNTVVIAPEDILKNYSTKSTVRERFLKLVENARTDKVPALAANVAAKMMAEQRKFEAFSKQLALFMDDLPEDVMIAFVKGLSGHAKANGCYPYFLAFSEYMSRDKSYNKTVERLKRAQLRGDEEAKKTG